MKKRIISVLLILALVLSAPAVSATDTYNGRVAPSFSVGAPALSTLKGAQTYPAYYNSVDQGYVSAAKDQQTTETCWIFTQNDLLEISLRKKGLGDFDFSEQTVKFETSAATSPYGYEKHPNGGGNEFMSIAFLSRTGSVLESDEPFTLSEIRTANPDTLPRYGKLVSAPFFDYGVNNALEYKQDAVLKMKDLIMEYGAVGTGVFYDDSFEYHDENRTCYFYNGSYVIPNHAVTIVGWDDNFSRENFAQTPSGDGAFIVKNSWGNTHNNDTSCYFYISYYDKLATYQFFALDYDLDTSAYDNIYQYDHQGMVLEGGVKGKTALCVTNFTANSRNESVSGVSFYVVRPDTDVEVLVSANGGEYDRADSYDLVYKKHYDAAGYYHVEFDPVKLGSLRYSVAVRFTTDETQTKFAICANTHGLVTNAVNVPDTCYAASDFSKLASLESSKIYANIEAMHCIKAYTSSDPDTATPVDAPSKFTDVPAGKWYTDAVNYALTYGVFGGTSDTTFEPSTEMTRAMFVRVLANILGADLTYYNNNFGTFSDIKSGSWYEKPVAWAADNGIVNGVEDKKFAPNDVVTREQMCVMLVRFCDYIHVPLDTPADAVRFADDANIRNYAKPAVYACRAAGIINGVSATEFAPRESATRAQVAQLMRNFCRNYVYR